MSNRLSKDELESDALVTSYVNVTTFYKKNKGTIYGGLIALVVIAGGIFWYITNSAAQESDAREAMTFAEQQFLNGNFETALYGSDEQFEPGFVEITARFGRTTAGNLAFYYAAVSHAELGEYEQALEMIRKFNTPSGVMGVAPMSLQGMILMQLERYSDASAMFERAANWDENNATTPFNLMQAAEAAYAANNYSRAQSFVQKIRSEYPNSEQATQAIRMEGMLSARL